MPFHDGLIDLPRFARERARREGETRYFNGGPCPAGHIAERHTASGRCVECVAADRQKSRAARAAATRADRDANPQKWREYARTSNARRDPALRRAVNLRPERRLANAVRARFQHLVRTQGLTGRWRDAFGYGFVELARHLELQWAEGMTWENYGREWVVDHIVPLCAFKAKTVSDAECQAAWALTNLRPLWASDNLRKNGKRTHLL